MSFAEQNVNPIDMKRNLKVGILHFAHLASFVCKRHFMRVIYHQVMRGRGVILNAKLVVETVGGEPYEFEPLGQYIVRAVGVCGGRPIVKYTRIEMSHLLDRVAQGDNISEIVGDYRGRVSREAVVETIKIANCFFEIPFYYSASSSVVHLLADY